MKARDALWLVLALMSCGRSPEVEAAEDADDLLNVLLSEATLIRVLTKTDNRSFSLSNDERAALQAAEVQAAFTAGCSRATPLASNFGSGVSYAFSNCVGPYGLRRVSGAVQVTSFNPPAGQASTTSRLESRLLTATSQRYGSTAAMPIVDVSTRVSPGVTAMTFSNGDTSLIRVRDGATLERTNEFAEVVFEEETDCVLVRASWQSRRQGRAGSSHSGLTNTRVVRYRRCVGCPLSGAVVNTVVDEPALAVAYEVGRASWHSATAEGGFSPACTGSGEEGQR